MQGYPLALSALLAVMQGVSGTHWFRAELPAHSIGKDLFVVEIMLHDGKLMSCQLNNRAHQVLVLPQGRAVSMVEEMGELNWSLVSPPPPTIHKPLELPRKRLPVRLITGTLPTTLSHRQKQVLSLMDGERTVEQIARLLHLEPAAIRHILLDLHQQHLIAFEERNH